MIGWNWRLRGTMEVGGSRPTFRSIVLLRWRLLRTGSSSRIMTPFRRSEIIRRLLVVVFLAMPTGDTIWITYRTRYTLISVRTGKEATTGRTSQTTQKERNADPLPPHQRWIPGRLVDHSANTGRCTTDRRLGEYPHHPTHNHIMFQRPFLQMLRRQQPPSRTSRHLRCRCLACFPRLRCSPLV